MSFPNGREPKHFFENRAKEIINLLDEACEHILLTGDYDAAVSWQLIKDTIPCHPWLKETRGYPE